MAVAVKTIDASLAPPTFLQGYGEGGETRRPAVLCAGSGVHADRDSGKMLLDEHGFLVPYARGRDAHTGSSLTWPTVWMTNQRYRRSKSPALTPKEEKNK